MALSSLTSRFLSSSLLLAPSRNSDERSQATLRIRQQHGEFVWLSLQRLGVAFCDLDDVFQEVFIVVHRKLPTFDGSCKITTWLFSVSFRVAASYRRRAHRRRETMYALPPEEVSSNDPEADAARTELRTQLAQALDALPLEKRALLVMYEIDELTCPEIADILGIPLGTVHSRLHAARRSFEALLNSKHRSWRGR